MRQIALAGEAVSLGDLAAAGMFLLVCVQAIFAWRRANLEEKRRLAADAAAKAKGKAEESAIVTALKDELEQTRKALKDGLDTLGRALQAQALQYGKHELDCTGWRSRTEQLLEGLVKTQERFGVALEELGSRLSALAIRLGEVDARHRQTRRRPAP